MEKSAAHQIVLRKGWLRHTPAPFQRAVVERSRLEQFPAGTPVYSLGDDPGGMFGIVAGCLGVSVALAMEDRIWRILRCLGLGSARLLHSRVNPGAWA